MARGYSNAGGGVVLDSELDLNSQNGVKNSVITTAINSKANQDSVDQISSNLTSLEATVQQNTDDITNVDATVNSLATVARTGSYNDLIDKPVSQQVQADWSQSNSSAVDYIKNKPAIPTVDQTYDSSSANAQSGAAVASVISGVEAGYTAQDNTIINAINTRKFVYFSIQIIDTATEGTYAWASNTDSDTSGTYPYVYTGTFGVVGGLAYNASNKFGMIINFPPAKAVSGDYAPFCTFSARDNGGQTWFDYKIYAKAIPSNGFTVDVVVMGQYPAIGTISNS